MLIFEQGHAGRRSTTQASLQAIENTDIPAQFLRKTAPKLPEVSELQVVRHYTRLSQKNFLSIRIFTRSGRAR
jgi:glycine dehydrogenase subunit 2